MHREVIALMLAFAAIATSAGCGSAGTGSGCSNVEADLKGIYAYSKRQLVWTPHVAPVRTAGAWGPPTQSKRSLGGLYPGRSRNDASAAASGAL